MNDTKIYTVTQITKDIRGLLEDVFSDVWVEGEVSNFKLHTSGHAYFSLKDKNSVINCVMFRSHSSRIKFAVEDGMKVVCSGRVSVYDKRGQYQLYANTMEPKGKGALGLAFEQLKKKLYEEGLFDDDIKKPLPVLPLRVGVITSATGAAVRDILEVTKRRYSNIQITIRPVQVQGDTAKDEIAEAIKELNEFNSALSGSKKEENPIDVIILGRGGGSLEDLWAFNEEVVARAIASSGIPIVSAVGHEIDYTISDFVADLRAATPSAAAEVVVPLKDEVTSGITGYRERMYLAVTSKIKFLEKEVKGLKESYVLRAPLNVFSQMRQEVDELIKFATSNVTYLVELKRGKVEALAGKLKALSPLAVLDRGYSITFKNGKVVKDSKELKNGDILETKFAKGKVASTVKK